MKNAKLAAKPHKLAASVRSVHKMYTSFFNLPDVGSAGHTHNHVKTWRFVSRSFIFAVNRFYFAKKWKTILRWSHDELREIRLILDFFSRKSCNELNLHLYCNENGKKAALFSTLRHFATVNWNWKFKSKILHFYRKRWHDEWIGEHKWISLDYFLEFISLIKVIFSMSRQFEKKSVDLI